MQYNFQWQIGEIYQKRFWWKYSVIMEPWTLIEYFFGSKFSFYSRCQIYWITLPFPCRTCPINSMHLFCQYILPTLTLYMQSWRESYGNETARCCGFKFVFILSRARIFWDGDNHLKRDMKSHIVKVDL